MTKAAPLSAQDEAAILARYVQAQREEEAARDLFGKTAVYERMLEAARAEARQGTEKKQTSKKRNTKQKAGTKSKVKGGGVGKPKQKTAAKRTKARAKPTGKK
jgi:hypothetical protein